jgi:hypothetical protein
MTSGLLQQIITLPPQGCDTIQVQGFFTAPGNCMDNINTAMIITAANDTLTADTCVTVMFPCWQPGINIIQDSTFASALGTGGFSNSVVYIENRFYIDIDFIFSNCTVYVGAGGEIIVLNEFTLTLDSTIVTGCERMWKRILLQPNGATVYVINNSKIMDAHWGIYANDGTRFSVTDSDISECVYGIFVPPNQFHTVNYITATVEGSRFGLINGNMKGQYNGQPNDYSPNGPKAGMELHDVRVIGIGNYASTTPNFFGRLHTGIVSYNSFIRFIRNSEFVLIGNNPDYSQSVIGGSAVVSIGQQGFPPAEVNLFPLTSGGATIVSCKRGVYAYYSTTRVSDVKMINVETGVYSEQTRPFGETKVSNCNINASVCGIDFFNNHGCWLMSADNNQITIGQFGTGVRLRELLTPNNSNYRIIYNRDIVMNSASTGIHAMNVDRAVISDNNIIQKQTAPLGFESDMTGILIEGCRRTVINCNTVTRHSSISDFYTYGYRVNESPQNMMDCNLADKNDVGVFFGGSNCTGTLFRRNTMRDNFIGLYLNGSAKIGQQPANQIPPYHGNRWEGTFSSNFGAVNWNWQPLPNLNLNLFTILDPNQPGGDAAHNPNIPTGQTGWPNNTGWFDKQLTGNTLSNCTSHTLCGGALPDFTGGEEDDYTLRLIALDSALTADFPEETKLMDKQRLYSNLTEDSLLLASDTLFQLFKNDYDSASIGYLYEARKVFALAGNVDSLLKAEILFMQQTMSILNDSIAKIDSLYHAAPDSSLWLLRSALMDSVSHLEQSISLMAEQLKTADSIAVIEAEIKNASVQPAGLPDSNEKTMNEIQSAWQLGGRDAVENRYNDALAIAMQCPYQGGPSVYQARVFVSMFNDSIQYDDKTTCQQAGYYRQQLQQVKKQIAGNSVEIIPNPANETVIVKLQTSEEGLCSVRLLTPAGATVMQGSFACKEKQYRINTANMAPGIYYVEVKAGNTIFRYSKLTIMR